MSAYYTCPASKLWTEQYDITYGGTWEENSTPKIGSSSSRSYATLIYFDTPSSSAVQDCNFLNIVLDLSSSSSANVILSLCEANHSSFNFTKYECVFNSLSSLPTDSSRVASAEVTIDSDNTNILLQLSSKLRSDTSYCLFINPKGNSSGIVQLSEDPVLKMAELAIVTVKYDLNGASGTPPASHTGIEGQGIILSNVTPTRSPDTSTTKFVITGNANGGDSNTSVTATKTNKIVYEFLGWSKDPDYDAGYYPGDTLLVQNSDITLYAVWYETSNTTTYSNNTLNDLPIPTKSLSNSGTYTITLDPQGGKLDKTTYTIGASGSYSFDGWYSTRECSGSELGSSTEFTQATTVYAKWDDSNIISNPSIILPSTARDPIENTVYAHLYKYSNDSTPYTTLSAVNTTSYTLDGWGTTSTIKSYNVGDSYTPTKNITLYAIWKSTTAKGTMTLPYFDDYTEKNGICEITYDYQYDNKTETITTDKITTYTFKGWSSAKNATTKNVQNPYTTDTDRNLYGVWGSSTSVVKVKLIDLDRESDITPHIVTLNYRDGTTPNKTNTVNETTSYDLLGWGETSSATSYKTPGTMYDPSSGKFYYDSTTLYAIWKTTTTKGSLTLPSSHTRADDVITRSVTLEYNNNKTASETRKVNETTKYTLDGWGTTESVKSYSAGASYTPTSDVTLYAIWKSSTTKGSTTLPNPTKDSVTETYVVTLNPNKGTVSPTSFNYTKSSTYSFNGWYTDDNVKVSSPYTPTSSSTTLSAVWNESSSSSDPIQLPEAKREGYEFQGWGKSATSAPVSNSYIPTESITLYAIWELGGIVHIGNKSGLILIYHDGSWCQAIPNLYNNGDFRICI